METFEWGEDSDELDTSPPRQRPRNSLQTRDDLHGTPFNNGARSWDPEEDTRLRNAIEEVGCKWMAVAQLVGGGRSPAMCRNRFQRMQAPIHGKRAVNLCSACGQPKRGHTCNAKLDTDALERIQQHPPLPFAAAAPGGAPGGVVDTLRPRTLQGDQLRAPLRDLPVRPRPSPSLAHPAALEVPDMAPEVGAALEVPDMAPVVGAALEVPDMAPEVGVDASYVDEFDAMTEYDDEPHMALDECPASGGGGSGGGGGGTGTGTGTARGGSAFERPGAGGAGGSAFERPGSATGAISGGTSSSTSESAQLGGRMMLEHHEAAYSSAYWTLAALGMALGSPVTTPEPTRPPLVPFPSYVADELFPATSLRRSVCTEPSDVSTALDTAFDTVPWLDCTKTLDTALGGAIAELDFTPASHFVSELLGLERHTERHTERPSSPTPSVVVDESESGSAPW